MESLFSFILFAITSSITPGPNNIMIMSSGLNYGMRKSIPHFWGITIGVPLMVISVGMGMASFFELFPLSLNIIKISGIIYLFYLSYKIATSIPSPIKSTSGKPLSFIQSLLFQWLNAKAWVIVIGAIATYSSSKGNYFIQILIMAVIFLITVAPSIAIWLFFGKNLQKFFKSELHYRIFNISMGILLVLSILPSAIEVISEFI